MLKIVFFALWMRVDHGKRVIYDLTSYKDPITSKYLRC